MLIAQTAEDSSPGTAGNQPIAKTLADVRKETLTGELGDKLLELDDRDSPEAKLQISAINTVARVSACAPDDLPADPAWLRQHLATISPAMAGLTNGSWSSVRSRILRALQRAEVPVMTGRRTKPLSDDWAQLYGALRSDGKQAALGRLIGYLSDRGVSPQDVSDGHIDRFAWALSATSLRGQPTALVRAAIRSWNAAVKEVPGWPQHQLTLPEIKRDGYVLPTQSFSATFQSRNGKDIAEAETETAEFN